MNDPAFWEQRFHGLLRIAGIRPAAEWYSFSTFLAAWMVLLVPVEKGATAAKSGLLKDDFHFCRLLGNSASGLGQAVSSYSEYLKEIIWSLRAPANEERGY